MNIWIYVFDEGNDINCIIYLYVKKIEVKFKVCGILIKYVCEGEEIYLFEGKKFVVCLGQFLVINYDCDVYIKLKFKKDVKGICFYLDFMLFKQWD